MSQVDLPAPATQADEYLYDIALSLRALVRLATQQSAVASPTDDDDDDLMLTPIPLRERGKRRKS